MPEMELVRTSRGEIRGFTEGDDKKWKRYCAWVEGLEPGEFFTLVYKQPRNLRFHRKFFAMLNHSFEHWEPEQGRKRFTYKGRAITKDFDQFRKDILILAGFYEARYDLKGRVELQAKSIAFDKMEEDEFERVYEAVLKVLLEQVLTNYTRDDLDRVVEQLQAFG